MISLKILHIKNFMSKLLIKDVFDHLYVSEAIITTFNTFQINGQTNKEFYRDDESKELPMADYSTWSKLRPFCLELIKGNKTPSFLKTIFLLPNTETEQLLNNHSIGLTTSDINGLFINIKYSDGQLTCITGTSIKLFTLDKSLEQAFDSYVKQFLSKNEIDFEEL